jgi:hypothetical protein
MRALVESEQVEKIASGDCHAYTRTRAQCIEGFLQSIVKVEPMRALNLTWSNF